MSHQGWAKTSFKPGDEVTVTMNGISKVTPNVGRITKVLLPNGQELAEVGRGAGVPGRNDDNEKGDK